MISMSTKPVQAIINETLFIKFKKQLLDDGKTVQGWINEQIQNYVDQKIKK